MSQSLFAHRASVPTPQLVGEGAGRDSAGSEQRTPYRQAPKELWSLSQHPSTQGLSPRRPFLTALLPPVLPLLSPFSSPLFFSFPFLLLSLLSVCIGVTHRLFLESWDGWSVQAGDASETAQHTGGTEGKLTLCHCASDSH